MERYQSKRSCMTSEKKVGVSSARRHWSEITDIKRRPESKTGNPSSRRLFLFKGSQTKRQTELQGKTRSRRTPANSKNGSIQRTTSHSVKVRQGRSTIFGRGKVRSRSRSTIRTKPDMSAKLSSRSASVGGSQPGSRKESIQLIESPSREGATVNTKDTLIIRDQLPEIIHTEESKLVQSSPKTTDSEEESPLERKKQIELSKSPSIVGYRKVVYDESTNKWVEHWKMIANMQKFDKVNDETVKGKNMRANNNACHKVKGRCTARMQMMFPTAIIRPDRRHGFQHNIMMTDNLRIELHKRKAPIVPTYFQDHILKFGKLPFRNNPRPHLVV
ncbi:hypothetical protein PGB90_005055 [Kerria lacca]